MRKILLLLIISLYSMQHLRAQDTYVVQQFGRNLSSWASGQNAYSALEALERVCSQNPAILIGDEIMSSLAHKNGLAASESYKWDNYLTCMQKEVDKGITIAVSKVEAVPYNLIPDKYKNDKSLHFVSGNIRIAGASNFDVNDLFVLKNGKIVKIQNYQVYVDKKGRRRIHVDLSDLGIDEDTEGWGLAYNYGKAFPIGVSVSYTKWKFMISGEFGWNTDKDLYTTQKVEFNNVCDYKITKGEYDLKYYLTATPAFYMKYFAIGWGFGVASLSGEEVTRQHKVEVSDDGSMVSISTGATSSSSTDKTKFMMRPTVRGYIPCSDNFFISLSVNYDWIMGYKEKSGISFGVGVQFLLD